MQKAIDINVDTLRPKTLVMAPPLWGKTRFAATYPGTTYFFDFDGNMATIKAMPREIQEKVFYDTFKDVITEGKAPNGYMDAKKILDVMLKSVKEKGFVEIDGIKIDHVVIDSATTLTECCMNLYQYTVGRIGQMPLVEDFKTNDYSGALHYFKQFVFRTLALPIAVTLNCHEHVDANETAGESMAKGGIKRVYPDIMGKLATQISSRFMFAFRLTSGSNNVRMLLTKPKGLYYAGHRFQDALEEYEKADWSVVLGKVNAFMNKNAGSEPAKGGV